MITPDAPVLQSVREGVATLTLNRPQVRNALDPAMLEHLESALLTLREDASVRVVVLHGNGDGFMAGGDIKHFEGVLKGGDTPAQIFSPMVARVNLIVQLLRDMPQPVIAAVHGACAGFGLSLALACDLIIAAEGAQFTLAYDRLGLTPDGGASWQLVHTLGLKRAAGLALLGEVIDAATAERWGLVNRVVALADLPQVTEQAALRLGHNAPEAQARLKHLLNFAAERHLAAQLESEAESFAHLTNTGDFAEGVAAFLGKRTPKFKGN